MRLSDRAAAVDLTPLRYQFTRASGDHWDDNWLVIRAEVTTPTVRRSFTDACLLTDEARRLSAWLRAVADGRRPDAKPDPEGDLVPDLAFLEPLLAFSQVRWHDGAGVLRVRLSPGDEPVQGRDESPDDVIEIEVIEVEIETDRAGLTRAAEEWDRLLAPFPPR
ncbi:hypothetical protein [Streptomyces sp. NPDC014894]|uniref:WapI family immunity protein n=1 Tax=Streptomyces sp. NPDC014894 TaxID=3364931 RepID=UPI0037035818